MAADDDDCWTTGTVLKIAAPLVQWRWFVIVFIFIAHCLVVVVAVVAVQLSLCGCLSFNFRRRKRLTIADYCSKQSKQKNRKNKSFSVRQFSEMIITRDNCLLFLSPTSQIGGNNSYYLNCGCAFPCCKKERKDRESNYSRTWRASESQFSWVNKSLSNSEFLQTTVREKILYIPRQNPSSLSASTIPSCSPLKWKPTFAATAAIDHHWCGGGGGGSRIRRRMSSAINGSSAEEEEQPMLLG